MPTTPMYVQPGPAPTTMATQWYIPQPHAQPPAVFERAPASMPISRPVAPAQIAPQKFVLPSPQALGVSTTLAAPAVPSPAHVDWNQIQSRIERLGVLKYEKERVGESVRVRLILPTSDPNLGQPVTAQAGTEAAAILLALDHAEAWVRKPLSVRF